MGSTTAAVCPAPAKPEPEVLHVHASCTEPAVALRPVEESEAMEEAEACVLPQVSIFFHRHLNAYAIMWALLHKYRTNGHAAKCVCVCL